MLRLVLSASALALIYALLNEAGLPQGVLALTVGGSFIALLILGILQDA